METIYKTDLGELSQKAFDYLTKRGVLVRIPQEDSHYFMSNYAMTKQYSSFIADVEILKSIGRVPLKAGIAKAAEIMSEINYVRSRPTTDINNSMSALEQFDTATTQEAQDWISE